MSKTFFNEKSKYISIISILVSKFSVVNISILFSFKISFIAFSKDLSIFILIFFLIFFEDKNILVFSFLSIDVDIVNIFAVSIPSVFSELYFSILFSNKFLIFG